MLRGVEPVRFEDLHSLRFLETRWRKPLFRPLGFEGRGFGASAAFGFMVYTAKALGLQGFRLRVSDLRFIYCHKLPDDFE